jgi:hypothetical protein
VPPVAADASPREPGSGRLDASTATDQAGADAATDRASTSPSATAQAGPAPLRSLTGLELRNTLRDLLGEELRPGEVAALQDWHGSNRSGYRDGAPIDERSLPALFEAVTRIARRVAAGFPARLPPGCLPLPNVGEEGCARAIVTQLGRRAFRRPVDTEETAALMAIFNDRRAAGAEFNDAVRPLIAALLLSPHFLYHWDVTLPPANPLATAAPLDAFSLAARLSYGLWASLPDETLASAADSGALMQPGRLEAEARRLLRDPRALPVIQDFHRQWLMLDWLEETSKDRAPDFRALVRSMLAETDRFVADLYTGPGATGSLETLLLSNRTTVDAPLARLYGLPPLTGTPPVSVTLNPAQRAGILTQASFLTAHAAIDTSDPVRRGIVILRRVVCLDVPDEPPNVDIPPPQPLPANLTTRERYEIHGRVACARACHDLIDPAGFAFEHYGEIGAFRMLDNGKPVDASGTLKLSNTTTISWRDAPSFVRALAATEEVPACLTRQWFRYLLRRHEDAADESSLREALASAQRHRFDLRELVVALTLTPAFTHRALALGEGTP